MPGWAWADLLSPLPMKFTSWAQLQRAAGIMLISVIASAAKVFGYLFNESETHASTDRAPNTGPLASYRAAKIKPFALELAHPTCPIPCLLGWHAFVAQLIKLSIFKCVRCLLAFRVGCYHFNAQHSSKFHKGNNNATTTWTSSLTCLISCWTLDDVALAAACDKKMHGTHLVFS